MRHSRYAIVGSTQKNKKAVPNLETALTQSLGLLSLPLGGGTVFFSYAKFALTKSQLTSLKKAST